MTSGVPQGSLSVAVYDGGVDEVVFNIFIKDIDKGLESPSENLHMTPG